jgi:hypothetical protein
MTSDHSMWNAMTDTVLPQIAVPNGLLFVRDSEIRRYPDLDDEKRSFWSIPSCVMIACLVDCDGETDITIGAADQIAQERQPSVDRMLETPSRKIILEIVPGDKVHEVTVPADSARIRIWTDGQHRCAQTVAIGID